MFTVFSDTNKISIRQYYMVPIGSIIYFSRDASHLYKKLPDERGLNIVLCIKSTRLEVGKEYEGKWNDIYVHMLNRVTIKL